MECATGTGRRKREGMVMIVYQGTMIAGLGAREIAERFAVVADRNEEIDVLGLEF